MKKIKGKVILQVLDTKLDDVYHVESYLNNEVAALVFEKYGIGLRVHIQELLEE